MNEALILEFFHKRTRRFKYFIAIYTLLLISAVIYMLYSEEISNYNFLTYFSFGLNWGLFLFVYQQNNFSDEEILEAIQSRKAPQES